MKNEITTIQFDCPHCGQICAFKSKHAGRTARCLKCDAHFTIPAQTGQPARLFDTIPPAPQPYFYVNAIKGSLQAFAHRESIVGQVFCAALVIFHFVLGNVDLSFTLLNFRPPLAIGWVTTLVTFGLFSWYCLETINTTYLGVDSLPPIEPGFGFEFFILLFRSCYLFLVTFVIALLPASVISALFESFQMPLGPFYYILAALCLLIWPINLAIIALNVPMWRIFRYDLLLTAIFKTFKPYLFTAIFTVMAFSLVYRGMAAFATDIETPAHILIGLLLLRLAGAFLFLFAMRIIGTYCLHHADLCPKLWAIPSSEQALPED